LSAQRSGLPRSTASSPKQKPVFRCLVDECTRPAGYPSATESSHAGAVGVAVGSRLQQQCWSRRHRDPFGACSFPTFS
jgi:hypothetical protein